MAKYLRWLVVIDTCRLLEALGLVGAACWVGQRSGLHDAFQLLWFEIDHRGQQRPLSRL